MPAIHLTELSFSHSSAVTLLDDVDLDLGPGWTGLVGANGAGKSTLLQLIAGRLPPDTGRITVEPSGSPPTLCEQRVDELDAGIEAFAWNWDRDAVRMRARLDLDAETIDRWPTLSPGERKRWQIGAALAEEPPILLLDEPTNHLDVDARELLTSALASFRGCGIVVSHDRTLLNDLTTRTMRVVSGRVELWNGGYDEAKAGWEATAAQQRQRIERLKSEQKKLARRIADQRRKSQQKDAERIRERRAAGKHDLDTRGTAASYKHERGQKTGAQTVFSMTNSLDRVSTELEATSLDKELGGDIGFEFEPARKEFLVRFDGPVAAGEHELFTADVEVRRTDRIHVAGPNGAGKSSLLEALVASASVPTDHLLHLRQETTADEAATWLSDVRSLPSSDLGRVMSIVAVLGSDPGPLLSSDQPSPGEARKLALALALGTPRWLLVLDEPTNHLDLPSIERLERALVSYPGALLLVTHDDRLAGAATHRRWTVDRGGVAT